MASSASSNATTSNNNGTFKLHTAILVDEVNFPSWIKAMYGALSTIGVTHCALPDNYVDEGKNPGRWPNELPARTNFGEYTSFKQKYYRSIINGATNMKEVFPGSFAENIKAVHELNRHLSPPFQAMIADSTMAYEAIKTLKQYMSTNTATARFNKCSEFQRFTQKPTETVDEYINRFAVLFNEIKNIVSTQTADDPDLSNYIQPRNAIYVLVHGLLSEPFGGYYTELRTSVSINPSLQSLNTLYQKIREKSRDIGFKPKSKETSTTEDKALYSSQHQQGQYQQFRGRGRSQSGPIRSNQRQQQQFDQYQYSPYPYPYSQRTQQYFNHPRGQSSPRASFRGQRGSFVRGRGGKFNQNNNNNQNKDKSTNDDNNQQQKHLHQIKCNNCHGFGHYARNCPSPKDMSLSFITGENDDMEIDEQQQYNEDQDEHQQQQEQHFDGEYDEEYQDYSQQGF